LLEEQLLQHAKSLGANMAAIVAEPVLTNNVYELHKIIKQTLTDDIHTRYIFILDKDNRIMVSSFAGGLPKGLRAVNGIAGNEISIKTLETDEGVIWDVATPIANGLGGTIRIGITDHYRVMGMKQVSNNIIMSTFLIILVALLMAYLLTRLITNSLLKLDQTTRLLGQGKYNISIKPDLWAGKEIYNLYLAFNEMIINLNYIREKEEQSQIARKNLLQKTINAQEEERKRIARELHDETNQYLAVINYGLDSMLHMDNQEQHDEKVAELKGLVKQASDGLRSLAWELRPKLLDEFGLVLALNKYLEYFTNQYEIAMDISSNIEYVNLPKTYEISVYRIVQEALINVIKHAKATKVNVSIQKSKENLIITIEDDGIGFSKTTKDSLGIYGMHERAALIGGKLSVESELGAGTTVLLSIELNRKEVLDNGGEISFSR
jgi:signal transduction histidine kinase